MLTNNLVRIDQNGFYCADFEEFLKYNQEAFKAIYGSDINLDADTQDGQLVTHFAQCMYDVCQICAKTFNGYSPFTAKGVQLSSQVKINAINRRGATNSTADLKIVGDVGTVITNGKAKDTNDNIWLLPERVLIPTEGHITVTATAQDKGAIKALANSINKIATPCLGWLSVNNPTDATVGSDTETDAQLRRRQQFSTAQASQSLLKGIKGAIANLDGVKALAVYENDTDEINSLGLAPHSICAVVEGGDALQIAEVIRLRKTLGVNTIGDIIQTVKDGKGLPINIRFYRPTPIKIKVKVTIKPLQGYSSTYANELKTEIKDYINNLGIGGTVYISKLYVPANISANNNDQTYDIQSIEIAKNEGGYSGTNIETSFKELPQTDLSLIEVVTND